VLAVLVAAGIYVPRYRKGPSADFTPVRRAPSETPAESTAPSPQPPTPAQVPSPQVSDSKPNPAPPPSPSPVAPDNVAPAPGKTPLDQGTKESTPVKPSSKPSGKVTASNKRTPQSDGMTTMEAPATPPPAPDAANLDEMEHEMDLLSNRAAAVNGSLDRLQQQQSSAGYGLRGDMAAKQASMKNNLSKAQDAVEHGDAARAKRYMTMAEGDVEALEHFLGH
jgi:hypothetical protein